LRPLDALRDFLRPLDLRPPLRPLDFFRPPDLRAPLRAVDLRRVEDLRDPPFLEADFFVERFALDLLRLAAIILCSHPFSGRKRPGLLPPLYSKLACARKF